MTFDPRSFRDRHNDMVRHLDDEVEFSLAAAEAIDDVPELLAEIDRLRERIHTAAADFERRHAPVQSSLDYLRNLMADALRYHNEEMARLGNQPGTHISMYGQAAAALLLAERERYRLAWTSARQRAANHLDALVDSDEERDALRFAVKGFTEELSGIREGEHALRRAAAVTDEVVARLVVERDEARGEVVRLGQQRDLLLNAGRAWLAEGFPTTGATVDALADLVEEMAGYAATSEAHREAGA